MLLGLLNDRLPTVLLGLLNDIHIVFSGRVLLTDVAVTHPLTPSVVGRSERGANRTQLVKNAKYARVASQMGAELLNVAIDMSGSLASGAMRLVEAIGEEGERSIPTAVCQDSESSGVQCVDARQHNQLQ